MSIKYLFDAVPYDYYRDGRNVLKSEYYMILRIHEIELEVCFYNKQQVMHKVYIVAREDTRITHLESNTDEFKEKGVDKYVAAALYLLQQEFKKYDFNVINDNYIEFIKEHYDVKGGEEGISKSKYRPKSDRYYRWLIYLGIVVGIGIAVTIIFGFAYPDKPYLWIINIGIYLFIAIIILIFNNLMEKAPKDLFIKGKVKKEEKE